MLDDMNVLAQRDPEGALKVAATQYKQAQFAAEIINAPEVKGEVRQVVVAGVGGSALAALLLKAWLAPHCTVPFEVVRTYDVPAYVGPGTLVIASSYSGNTEETLSCLEQALAKGAYVAAVSSGGKLQARAEEKQLPYVTLPGHIQPRMTVLYNLRSLLALLVRYEVVSAEYFDEIAEASEWLHTETAQWEAGVAVDKNLAKQLALLAVGKTPVFYGGTLTGPAAYKWKISWNENAKNVAFWNELPEFNHNEFIGWSSHPVEKPFAVFDLVSSFEHERVLKRFEVTDRLLSGLRPKAHRIELQGDTPLRQLLWAAILADFASIYVAVLNGVDPTPVALVEKLKKELG